MAGRVRSEKGKKPVVRRDHPEVSMNHFLNSLLLVLTVSFAAVDQASAAARPDQPGDKSASPPIEFNFNPTHRLLVKGLVEKHEGPAAGVPKGRRQAYDPETGIFHVQFKPRSYAYSGFEVAK